MSQATRTPATELDAEIGLPAFDWSSIQEQVASAARNWAENRDLEVQEASPTSDGAFELRIAGVSFPNGVGEGTVVVRGLKVLGKGRIRIELEHNRVFAGKDRRLFLNDYLFITEFDRGETPSNNKLRHGFKELRKGIQGLATTRERVLDGQARLARKTLQAGASGETTSYRNQAEVADQ